MKNWLSQWRAVAIFLAGVVSSVAFRLNWPPFSPPAHQQTNDDAVAVRDAWTRILHLTPDGDTSAQSVACAPLQGTPPQGPSDAIQTVLNDSHQVGRDAFIKARELVRSNLATRQTLMSQYAHESDIGKRSRMRNLLSQIPLDELTNFATHLAESSDPSLRGEAFELLQSEGGRSPAAREFIRTTLRSESDPAVLARALDALQPGLLPPGETASVIAQLRELSQSPSVEVQASSLKALARWDKSAELQMTLAANLESSNQQLLEASLEAISENKIRTDAVKSNLLRLANNPVQTLDIRFQAAQMLTDFPLSQQEYAVIVQVLAPIQN